MVGLPGCVFVDFLVVDHPSWCSIGLGCDDHPAGPGHRLVDWNAFDDA